MYKFFDFFSSPTLIKFQSFPLSQLTKVFSDPPNTTIQCKRSHKRNSINQCLKQPYMQFLKYEIFNHKKENCYLKNVEARFIKEYKFWASL